MLPSDADLAGLCAAIYRADAAAVFDHYDAGDDDGVCWAIKRLAGRDVVVFRGSLLTFGGKLLPDWLRDFNAVPIKTRIGTIHAGFYAGIEHAWLDIRALLKQPWDVIGHSLGASRAAVLTGAAVKDGQPPEQRVVFGEPKPGFQDLADLVATVPGRSYCNVDGAAHDLVTDEPRFPLFVRATPLIRINAAPDPHDLDLLFRLHHVQLYQAALTPSLVPISV